MDKRYRVQRESGGLQLEEGLQLQPIVPVAAAGGNIRSRSRSGSSKRSSVSNFLLGSVFGSIMNTDGLDKEEVSINAHADLSRLVDEIVAYRNTITAEQQVELDGKLPISVIWFIYLLNVCLK